MSSFLAKNLLICSEKIAQMLVFLNDISLYLYNLYVV